MLNFVAIRKGIITIPGTEMTDPGLEPRTFSTEVRCPYPYTTKSLGKLVKKIMEFII